jgi:hypothetical protein
VVIIELGNLAGVLDSIPCGDWTLASEFPRMETQEIPTYGASVSYDWNKSWGKALDYSHAKPTNGFASDLFSLEFSYRFAYTTAQPPRLIGRSFDGRDRNGKGWFPAKKIKILI